MNPFDKPIQKAEDLYHDGYSLDDAIYYTKKSFGRNFTDADEKQIRDLYAKGYYDPEEPTLDPEQLFKILKKLERKYPDLTVEGTKNDPLMFTKYCEFAFVNNQGVLQLEWLVSMSLDADPSSSYQEGTETIENERDIISTIDKAKGFEDEMIRKGLAMKDPMMESVFENKGIHKKWRGVTLKEASAKVEKIVDHLHDALGKIIHGYGGPGPSRSDTENVLEALQLMVQDTEDFLEDDDNFND